MASISIMPTPGGAREDAARPRGGVAWVSFLALVLLTAGLLCGGWTASAQAAGRHTRDKVKTTQASDKTNEQPRSVTINGKSGAGNDFPRGAGGPITLGATILKSPADFTECVRVSLAQSPLLTKSAIEIESKRLDVGDAYSQYIPTIILNTTFYLSLPKLRNTSGDAAMASYLANPSTDPVQNAKSIASLQQYAHQVDPNRNRKSYDLNFSTGAWNPLLTAFEVQARKELVNIAVLAHLKVIDQGLKRLASTFLQLGMVESLIKLAKEKEELAAKNLEYVKTRAGLGQGAQLDVRIAEGKINMAKAESDKMRTNRTVLLDELKFIMGVPFIQKVELNLNDYEAQVLENFNPTAISEEKVRQHSFPLRIKNYERALQKKNIALAYVHFMPTMSMGFTSVSTLDTSSYKSESNSTFLPNLYPNLQFSLPMDWWTKSRDVSRQYKKLSQLNVETHNLEFQIMSEYQQALAKLRAASSELKFAEANADVQKLQVQQAQLRFESGQAEYDAIVKAMGDYLESRQNFLQRQQDRNAAMLELRCLSGDFQDRYINATVMENL